MKWHFRLGQEGFRQFHVASDVYVRLGNDDFQEILEMWYTRLKGKFQTFAGTNSVAKRLGGDDFQKILEMWYTRLKGKFQTFAGSGSVAKRLGDDDFQEILEMWYDRLAKSVFVNVFGDGTCISLMWPRGDPLNGESFRSKLVDVHKIIGS
jgi:hypothetical protein